LNSNGQYNSTLPPGIPANQIPEGQEDLYILKSQVVVPVCPACPSKCASSSSSSSSSDEKTCPPCPACARCPDSNFTCKKVPDYTSISSKYLPQPYVNSFSSF
jgi:hypothetical protein